jgi:hypothetical protein
MLGDDFVKYASFVHEAETARLKRELDGFVGDLFMVNTKRVTSGGM